MPHSDVKLRDGRAAWRALAVVAGLTAAVCTGLAPTPAAAVFSGDMSPRAPSGDKDYAAGMEAWEKEDWTGVVKHMAQVVSKRPHHDNAWARLGFAHRKMRKYEASLFAYGRSLQLNPHNRAALEYLGEAYVETGRFVEAIETLERLRMECRRVELTFSDGAFSDGCNEFKSLKALIDLVSGEPVELPERW